MEFYNRPAKKIQILANYDVVICGGGPAGCSAAIASGRLGAKTLIIEKDGYLGGAAVSQLVSHVLSSNGVDFEGIWHDWMDAVDNRGGVIKDKVIGKGYGLRSGVDPEVVKYAWDDLLTKAGVDILHHCWCSEPIVKNGIVKGIVIENRTGSQVIEAKRIIDCTGDAVICAAAGVPFESGNGRAPWNQAMTKVFRMGNIKWPENDYEKINPGVYEKLKDVVANKEFDSPVVLNGRPITYATAKQLHYGSTLEYRTDMNQFPSRVLKVDPLDPWDMTRAEREGREQAWQCAEFIKKYIPGYEDSYLQDTNAHIGIRDSRRIEGRAKATKEDAVDFKKYDDGIAKSSWDIDIWPGDSYDKPAVPRDAEHYQSHIKQLELGNYFDIRYGCLVPVDIENLIVAGRCISSEREAQASLRIQQTCISTGQAAGTAAAMSLRDEVFPSNLDPNHLVKKLLSDRKKVKTFWVLENIKDCAKDD